MAFPRPRKSSFQIQSIVNIAVCLLFLYGFSEAVVIGENDKACGGSLSGLSGNLTSPGYPNNYAENLLCSWNVTVDNKFRIEIDFPVFEIEAGVGCLYDYVLIRDGLTANAPVLGKICHVNPQTILSTRSSVLIQFVSDMSVGKRGFYLRWRALPKVPLLLPDGSSVSSPWLAIPTPKDLAQIDGGISESLWGIDTSENVYIYFNNNWDLVDGRMSHVTSGESVFGISSNGDVWYRQGVLLENPKGFGWQQINMIQPIRRIDSGRKGIAVALAYDGSVYQLEVNDNGPTSVSWMLLQSKASDPLIEVSCGSYACWFVSVNSDVYIAKDINTEIPQSIKSFDSVLQRVSGVRMKKVVAGFGESVWGITPFGEVYKRTGINALSPEGSSWQKVPDVSFGDITVGLTGVYGLMKNGILITVDELKCGGILHEKNGQFSTPNFPDTYPVDLTCLWIIRVPDSKGIKVDFNNPVDVGKQPQCLDYVLTFENGKYPSQAEPLIECGSQIAKKSFESNEVWIEFRSTGSGSGTGFRATYEAWFNIPTTSRPVKTPIPDGWKQLKSPKKLLLVSASVKDDVWALDLKGRPYILSKDDWRPVSQNALKSLAVGMTGVWGVTENGKPLYRQGITSQNKQGLSWLNVDGMDFSKIVIGPMNEVIGIKRDGSLVWRFGVTTKSPSGTEWVDLKKQVLDASIGSYGIWVIDRSGILQFARASFNADSKDVKLQWRSSPGRFKKIRAGYGASLWAIFRDGKLLKRRDVNYNEPSGTTWQIADNFPANDISPGIYHVYRTLPDGTVVRRKDNICGGFLSTIQGSIESPDYPSKYPNNSHCLWTINVPGAKQIRLRFDDFDLDEERYCRNDRLSTFSPKVDEPEVSCGKSANMRVVAGDTMSAEFISGASGKGKGFRARYRAYFEKDLKTTQLPTTKATTPTTATTPTLTTTSQSHGGCGGSFFQQRGELKSPNYPQRYENSLDCKWFITVNPGFKVEISITGARIEADGQCGYDYIEIGDGARIGENARPRLCGPIQSHVFTSKGNKVWFRFFTDTAVTERGFKASWRAVSSSQTTSSPTTTMKTTTTAGPDYLPKGWSYISPASRRFVQADTGISNYIWAIDSNGRPFLRLNEAWIPVTDTEFLHITTGGSGTWAVTSEGRVVYRGGQSVAPEGSKWTSTGDSRFKTIDSGPYGFVTGVKQNNDVVYRVGVSQSTPTGTTWKDLNKKLVSVKVGSYGIWGIDEFQNVHFARRPSGYSSVPLNWKVIPGIKLKQIDAGFADNVYGVANDGKLYRREGITYGNPEGTRWSSEDADLKSVTVGLRGVFGIAKNHRVIYKSDLPTKCGGILTANSGLITSPGFPLSYRQNTHCLWIIKVPSAKSVRISVDSFDLYPSSDCREDYVLLFKRGLYSPADGVDRYCGSIRNLRRSIFDGDEVWILFQTRQTMPLPNRFRGFSLRYSITNKPVTTPTIPGCGGSFTRDYGSFSSPGYPNLYRNSLRCIWRITVNPERVVILSFDDFSLEEDITCRFDFLLVKTASQNGLALGKFCGSVKPSNIEVNGNKVWLLFKTDASESKRGFRITWSSKLKSGIRPRSTSKPITRRTPTTVPETQKPTETIRIPEDWSRVLGDVRFAHIDGGISPNAWAVDKEGFTYYQEGKNWRFVRGNRMKYVTSGESGVWAIDQSGRIYYRVNVAPLAPMGAYWDPILGPRLRKIDSGPSGVVIAVDEGNNLLLREGITMNNPKGTDWRTVQTGVKHISAGTYGYWITDLNNQVYFSPISRLYPLSRLRWAPVAGEFTQVKAGYGGSLWAVGPDGQLYRRRGITAISPTGLNWEKIGNLKVNGVTSGMSGVFASVLNTDETISTKDRRCGNILTDKTGTFSTPGYPQNYPSDTTCLWQIKIPGARQIIIEFESFNVEEGDVNIARCNRDYLLVLKDGKFPSAFAIQKRCGTDASPIIFNGDRAWIEFVSDSSVNANGFRANYRAVSNPSVITNAPATIRTTPRDLQTSPTTVAGLFTGCGGTIDASVQSSGSFAHPGYPSSYETYSNCRYVIKTAPNKMIKLDFDLFDLEGGQGCRYDYIEIFDGERRNDNVIGKYCGTDKPVGIVSTGNALYVEFVSDSTTVRPGFLARWMAVGKQQETTVIPTKALTTKGIPEGPRVDEIRKGCGGFIDATVKTSGTIAHPSYPNNYRSQVECQYVISTLPGKTITLSFEEFRLESSNFCKYDFLEVRDGKNEKAGSVGKFCGDKKPSPLTSSGNHLYFKFFSDENTVDKGFLAKWTVGVENTFPTVGPNTACGGNLNGDKGVFASPGYPGTYPTNLDCTWNINVDPRKTIRLTFEFFDLEKSDGCKYDFLEVFDMSSGLPRSMGKHCNKMPDELKIAGNRMRIRFYTDKGKSQKGFLARWSSEERRIATTVSPVTPVKSCFQRLSGIAGEIHRGGLSSSYQPNQDCVWIITVRKDERINLSFTFLDLEDSPFCTKDSLKILDGPNDISRVLGNFCGSKRVSDITSTGNEVFIRFKSDSNINRRGFHIKWRAVSPTRPTTPAVNYGDDICTSGSPSGSSGYIVSPRYPNNYPTNLSCRKVIRSAPGTRIVITFPDFSLQNSFSCLSDVLEIRDGSVPASPSLGNFCGSKVASEVKSSGNSVFIGFVSDARTTERGFRLFWKVERLPPTTPPMTTPDAVTTAKTSREVNICTPGLLTGASGYIYSPNYPNDYPLDRSCRAVIKTAPGTRIVITFPDFNLESSDKCDYDVLAIRDGDVPSAPSLGDLCGSKVASPVRSSGNTVFMEFVSDYTTTARGFRLFWRAEELIPTTPQITTPEKTRPKITTPKSVTTVRGLFDVDICTSGSPSGSSGYIVSPNYPNNYPERRSCSKVIRSVPGTRIVITFPDFNLESSFRCYGDVIEISDGIDENAPSLGKFCGSKVDPQVNSSGNSVFIRFKSDFSTSARGFRLFWKVERLPTSAPPMTSPKYLTTVKKSREGEVDICTTGRLSGSSGYVFTPNYPNNYPVDRSCRLVITSAQGTRIVITFPDFNLESSDKCNYDVLAIRDGDVPTAPSLGRFCGTKVDSQVTSSGNSILLEFVSDYETSARGFRLFWRAERSLIPTTPQITTPETVITAKGLPDAPVCGGDIFGSLGVLQSPSFSRQYPFDVSCFWVIQTGKSSVIDMLLTSFNPSSADCRDSYILLRDGMSSFGRTLAKWCGTDVGKSVSSSGNSIYVEYHNAAQAKGPLFDISWKERTPVPFKAFDCGGILTQPSGSIVSPTLPTNYGNDVLCTWNLVAPRGYRIHLEFIRFDMEESLRCSKDSFSLRDGPSSGSPVIGRFCGSRAPSPITSKLNSLFLEFKTDCKGTGTGFMARWRHVLVDAKPTNHMSSTMQTTPQSFETTTKPSSSRPRRETTQEATTLLPTASENSVNSRGGLLTGLSGIIRSPNFPKTYPVNQNIIWVIKGPANGKIAVTFRAFDLEDDSGCRYDFVQLRDGPSAGSPVMGRFCGRHIPATYTSANNALWIRFYSDSSDAGTGFEAIWHWRRTSNELPAQIGNLQGPSACGGVLEASEGQIRSPNYPDHYPPNKECVWIIKPKKSASISLRFKAFEIEPETRCGYDFLEVRNGDSANSPLLGRFCGSSPPDALMGTSGALWIRFRSDGSSNYNGFSASWKSVHGSNTNIRPRRSIEDTEDTVCGSALTGSQGTLKMKPPNDKKLNPNPLRCSWTIKSYNGAFISLFIRDLALDAERSCRDNYMVIRVEDGDKKKLLMRLCPSDTARWQSGLPIPTASKRVFVEYSTERSQSKSQLRVTWRTHNMQGNNPKGFPLLGTDTGCRERLTNPNGIITSPRFPNNYAINSLCVWIITLEDVNSIIKLKFDSFALEGHPLCRYDYLLIRDGDSQSSPVIGKYCGSSLPKEIRSTSNRLWLMLFSDSAFTGKGFRASYTHATNHRSGEEIIPSLTSAPVICGGFRSGDSGEITSPGYPTAYPKDVECMWTIQHPSSLIELSFETLDLEDTPQCQFDFVKIEDVGSTIRSLGKLCGTNVASNKFTGRKLRVTFKSDSSNSATGFKARWKSLRKQLDGKSNEGQECGVVKRGMVGFLRSNNYPENYNTNERCEWTILTPETGMNIQLRFADFNIEPSTNCEYDYLEVFDGESSASPSLGKFCGRQVPDLLQSTGDKIHVTFQTDNADTRPGFEIAWVAVFQPGLQNAAGVFRKARRPDTESCGGSFYSSEGTFETPNYPENYPARSLCTWVIQGRENSQIKLTFTTFDVEKHATCKYDHVVVRDGSTENSRMINTYCGDEIPPPVLSLGNSLWIQFKSDSSKQLKGFQASWKSVNKACGSRFSSKSGEISSPNYPAASTNRRFCTWIIDVPSAARIRLKFKDIDIRSSSSCSHGYVQIFDGDSSQQPSLGRFCHSFLPRPIVSSGNKIMIGFQSDDSGRTRGFKAEWMSIEAKPTLPPIHSLPATPCGTTLSQESGNIVLPRRVRSCTWLIKPSSGKRITLSVVKANLKPNPDCSKESLEIHNGFTSLAPLLLRICGRLQPQTVQSFTGVLRVKYRLQGEPYDQDVNLYWTTSKEASQNDIRNQGSCGVIKVPQQRFVNDRALVTSGSLPWIAALLSGSSSIYCGAAILSAKWVITAAHCFKRFSFNARRKIMVGELNLFETEGTEQEHNMKLIHIHPNYNPLTNENDIALINLEGKVTLNDKVNTVCLPSKKTNFQPGTVCSTGGWGTTRYLGRPSKPLVLARVPLVSSEVCNSTVAYRGSIKEDMVCAGNSDGGLDTCQGDGGGPLTCEIRPGKHILVGISSWGNGCASPNKYGVYTDVRKHLNWIESILAL